MVDKKALLEYIEGLADSAPQIDTNMPNLPVSAGAKRTMEDVDNADNLTDKRKIQKVESVEDGEPQTKYAPSENPEAWTIDQIYAQEKEKFNSADCMVSTLMLWILSFGCLQRVRSDFSFAIKFAKALLSERTPREKQVWQSV